MALVEKINLRGQPLDLDLTLSCGQAFRWKKRQDETWRGVVRDVLVELKSGGGALLWRTHPEGGSELVEDYLRLSDDVNSIYLALSASDPHLARLIDRFHGLRLLRQDPAETLLSFVCSAANTIPRITAAIETLSALFGELVCEKEDSCYYAFPRIEALARADRSALEATGSLAFRGANLKGVARQLLERGESWLMSLRELGYAKARDELLEITGVGRKIADCVCLFALDKDEAVPVDTHVRQLAQRLFLPDMKTRSITEAVYRRIQSAFAHRYGSSAGWAQQFLYYEDLLRTRPTRRGCPER